MVQNLYHINVLGSVCYIIISTVEPPNKEHFGNGPLVLCLEVVPISEVHDFSGNPF